MVILTNKVLLLANLGLAVTMLAVVAFLYYRKEFRVFEEYFVREEGGT